MPQRIESKKESSMNTFIKIVGVLLLIVAAFAAGYYTSNTGYRVVDSDGNTLVKSNAAQLVKDENSKLARDVIGKSEDEAKQLLSGYNRTFFVGVRDGTVIPYVGQKTFTNLTVEVKEGKVVRVLGWY